MQTVPTPSTAIPSRAVEGYAKEIFSTIDASQLPDGIVVTGFANTSGNNLSQPGAGNGVFVATPAPITDVFMAILLELRQMNVQLRAFNEGMWFNTNLNNQS